MTTNIFTTISDKLIANGAWLLLLSGFWVTLRLTVLSLLCGTLLALPLCAARLSKHKWLSKPASWYISLLRGTPAVLLLMLLYFVVFPPRSDEMLIGVCAFSLHFSATSAEIMRSALSSLSPGEKDAARALSLSPMRVFWHVTLPQAARVALPVYRDASVNLLQWTSVASYITLTDLTSVINSLQIRTMEPLLMLFVGIVLYLLLSALIYGLCALLSRRRCGVSKRYEREARS